MPPSLMQCNIPKYGRRERNLKGERKKGKGNVPGGDSPTNVAGTASCGKAGGQRFGRYFRLPHCFQAHCAGDLASAGPWHSSRVPTAFPCPWPGGERLRCRVPWGTCT
jgi:hypothetical protein